MKKYIKQIKNLRKTIKTIWNKKQIDKTKKDASELAGK